MVRLLKKENVEQIAGLVELFFRFQQHFTHIENVNAPQKGPCIYAMWHSHQCCVYGLPNRSQVSVMVSPSMDGEIVARPIKNLFGFKILRGSKGKHGAVEATRQMIEVLKAGECGAIMVDGPRGPLHEVKDGVIKIAKLSGAPIIPLTWYSSNFNFLRLPSWDKLEVPLCDVRLINLYGEPIYVPEDCDEEEENKIKKQLRDSLIKLDEIAPEEYKKVYRFGLWKKKIK